MTSVETTLKLARQKAIGKGILAKYKKFTDTTVGKISIEAAKEKLTELELEWKEFEENHQYCMNAADLDGNSEYFDTEYYEKIKQEYVAYHDALKVIASAGESPIITRREPLIPITPLEPIITVQSTEEILSSDGSTTSSIAARCLERKASVYRKLVRKIQDHFKQYCDNEETHEFSPLELKLVRSILLEKWEQLKTLSTEIIGTDSYNYSEYELLQQQMLQVYYDKTEQGSKNEEQIFNRSDNRSKMPKLTVPTFSGDCTEWDSFKSLFLKLVGNRNDCDGIEKLAYLRGQLKGEPFEIIKGFKIAEENYKSAWECLVERYENRHETIMLVLDSITNGEQMKKYSPTSMKAVIDDITKNVKIFQNMGYVINETVDIMLYQMVRKRLDGLTSIQYDQSLTDSSGHPRKYTDLMKFLSTRVKNASSSPPNQHEKHKQQPQKKFQQSYHQSSTVLAASSSNNNYQKQPRGNFNDCDCGGKHAIYKCPALLALPTQDRTKKVQEWHRCINCLKKGHGKKDCKSRGCTKCQGKHNTVLHFERKDQKIVQKQQSAKSLISSAIENENFKHVFLATAIINIFNKDGIPVKARALLDSGSQLNIMTEKLQNQLGIKHEDASMKVSGIGKQKTKSKKRVNITIQSQHSNYEANLEVFVLKQVTTCQPAHEINIKDWKIPKSVPLADPHFNIPATVDIIIGGEIFYKLISIGLISIGNALPDLQNTVFGWVVIGKLLGLEQNEAFVGIATDDSLNEQLADFWKIEEKFQPSNPLTELEQNCEQFFDESTKRDPKTGNSENMAVRRFMYLEKRFIKDPDMKADYVKFMREYEDLGHMVQVPKNTVQDCNYFIPHHAVRNPASSTTKFRVVFDGSAKTTSNVSLNELLANGPMLQDDLFSIMARFRTHQYVFSADITKMYRMVLVDDSHTKYQMIVWREDKSKPLKYYKLTTLTYGTTCASYLAIKSLQSLAQNYKQEFPLASVIAQRDFNVDDVMTGSNDLLEAINLQQQLVELCKKGGFELHKWCSNHPALLEAIPKSKQEISLDFNTEKTETKALGMKWIPSIDKFMLSYTPKDHKKVTKRSVLSETAQLFDPLGIVNPVIVRAKIFIQELWSLKLDWDQSIPMDLHTKWSEFRKELLKLNDVSVPRTLVIEDAVDIQLHAFSDASTRAYGAVFYIRSTNSQGETMVRVICSKSRVAPVSATTLPRLELCAAVTMVEMAEKLINILGIKFSNITYWTDSELVLSWIYTDTSYKTFVANRVATIKRKTSIQDWKYINTKDNPADLVSRGVSTEILIHSDLWWNGPEFLRKDKQFWPEIKPQFIREPSEERTIKTVLTLCEANEHFIEKIHHRNSIRILQRLVAYILRFKIIKHVATTSVHKQLMTCANSVVLTVEELQKALIVIIKFAQESCFQNEIALVKKGYGHKTKFANFVPILDADGVLRVGGRVQAASIPFEQRHPAILPKDHFVTRLILERIHLENMHAGPQALLAITRQKYWPESGKRLAQSIVRQCILCVRSKPILMQQIMGNLPKERVNIARAFVNVGLDFMGPVTIHYKQRGKLTKKAYVCVFVCFSTKAVHIEPAADLSTEGFVNCLKRFIARRGSPSRIFCDNGTNFRGLYNQLTELSDLLQNPESQKRINNYCQDQQITWKFIPPRSPHFNGFNEAAIKSAKLHLRKILHSVNVTYDELGTVVAQFEAILNSRPLTPMSNDPNDLQPLTAGHFLIGAPMRSMQDSEVQYSSKTKMWHRIVSMRNEFWQRWSKEYISELQSRAKWHTECKNVKIGDLVIVKEDNIPPLQWKMARVNQVVSDEKGQVRVVELKVNHVDAANSVDPNSGKINHNQIATRTSFIKRAIHRICPLPVDTSPIPTGPELEQEVAASSIRRENSVPVKQTKIIHTNSATPKEKLKKPAQNNRTNKPAKVKLNPAAMEYQPIARRTRSRKTNFSGHMVIMIITLLGLVVSAFGGVCNYTSFNHSPGLYFEKTGQMALSNDKWNMIGYIRLEPYWEQVTTLNAFLLKLDQICERLEVRTYRNVTRKQLRHQVNVLAHRNDLLRGFSQKPLVRKRRGMDDFLNIPDILSIKNSTSSEKTSGLDDIDHEEISSEVAQISQKELNNLASKLGHFMAQPFLNQPYNATQLISAQIALLTKISENSIIKENYEFGVQEKFKPAFCRYKNQSIWEDLANINGCRSDPLWKRILGVLGGLPQRELQWVKGLYEKATTTNEKTHLSRKRRGWANFIGSSLKVVGGVMDDADAQRIEQQVQLLNDTARHILKIVDGQTSIQDITQNIIKKEETAFMKQLNILETQVLNITTSAELLSEAEIFNTLAIQTLALITNHRETQRTMNEMITQVHHGRVSSTIITPSQLKQHLTAIAANITKDIMIPGGSIPKNVARIYGILEAKIKVMPMYVLLQLTLPLIHRDHYDLYHVIPVPFQYTADSMHIIRQTHQFIGINKRQDRYYMLNNQQKMECKAFSDTLILCEQKHILFNVQSGMVQCEMAILSHPTKGIPPKCDIKEISPRQVWSKLYAPNQFLFTVVKKTILNIICEKTSIACTVEDSGIISLPQQCTIQTENIEITAENIYESQLPVILVPGVNITEVIEEPIGSNITEKLKNQIQSLGIDPDLDILQAAIDQQRKVIRDDNMDELELNASIHHIHHYILLYIILLIIVCILVHYFCKDRCTRQIIVNRWTGQRTPNTQDIELDVSSTIPRPKTRIVTSPMMEPVSFRD